ncbi:MAG: hypothetical protein HPY59_12415 [Anaerolineae bacterium]|nr:hypothetical protein [Anaerolineae bacterium]
MFEVVLEDVAIDLRAEFDLAGIYRLADTTTAFQNVIILASIRKPSPVEQMKKLITHAENGCHAAQSFRNPMPVSLKVQLNENILFDYT